MMMKDQVSALMDGELDDDEARIVFGQFKQNAGARDQWEIYHLIGDGLRQTPVWDAGFPASFSARFAEKLAAEPTVLAPSRRPAFKRPLYALSAAASLAAVSLVAWTAFQFNQPDAVTTMSANKVAENEFQHDVNRYLIAHQEYSATPMSTSAAFSATSPYLNASLEWQQTRK